MVVGGLRSSLEACIVLNVHILLTCYHPPNTHPSLKDSGGGGLTAGREDSLRASPDLCRGLLVRNLVSER